MLHIIKPKYALPLDPDFFLGKINADTLINMGYADAKEYLASKKSFDWNDVAASTAMENASAVLHFRQHFSGTIMMNNERRKLQFAFSIFISAPRLDTQLFASVIINSNEIVSTFNNNIKVSDSHLYLDFDFLSRQKTFHAQVAIKLTSKIDFLLGMDCKRAKVVLKGEGINSPPAIFSQLASDRLKNAWQMNVRSGAGIFGKMKQRNQMLNLLYQP